MKRKMALLTALMMTVALPAMAQDMGGMGSSGGISIVEYSTGRSSGSGESRTVSHARSATTSTISYDALELTLPSQPMTRLSLGGAALNLALSGDNATFTAELVGTAAADDQTGDQAYVLVLTASGDNGVWQFDGQALRTLHNSGIAQLALRQGDAVLTLPTHGLLGGYAYDALKMAGVPGKGFAFAVDMVGPTVTVTAGDRTYHPGVQGEQLSLNGVQVGSTELLAAE